MEYLFLFPLRGRPHIFPILLLILVLPHNYNLPFVIADSGFGGVKQKVDRRLLIRKAQAAPETYPEFKGNVDCVQTSGFFRPAEESPSRQGYHWNGNAETYYLIGEAMGEAMKKLCAK